MKRILVALILLLGACEPVASPPATGSTTTAPTTIAQTTTSTTQKPTTTSTSTSTSTTTTSTSTTTTTANILCNISPSGGDDTVNLTNAIISCPKTYITGTLIINGTVNIMNDNREVIWNPGSKLKRVTQSNASTWQVMYFHNSVNLTLTNPTIEGNAPSCSYNAAIEHQHGLEFRDIDGLIINGGNISNMAGDGIYLDGNLRGMSNVQINNTVVNCTGRNSLSVIWGTQITATNLTLTNTGLWPIDIEPFNTRYVHTLTINNPKVLSNGVWLNATGPYLSCDIQAVINHPIYLDGSSSLWYADPCTHVVVI